MTLDRMVSQTVAWAHTVERALHEPGPFTFRSATGTTLAHRIVDQERAEIVFTGIAAPSPDGMVELLAGHILLAVTMIDFSKGDRITWRLSLRTPTPAS